MTARVWERVEQIPVGVRAVDVWGCPVVGGEPLLGVRVTEFVNARGPFTEVVA